MKLFLCSMLVAGLCLVTITQSYAEPTAVVNAPAGELQGQTDGAINIFKGVPFAQPPVGDLRWKAPIPMPRWPGVKSATEFGPECIQPQSPLATVYTEAPKPMSEDCLTLNVWAPVHAKNAPVFFWIYGGALWGGTNSDPVYDGSKLAQRGVIVVSINYRLGVLGWLAHPELSAEDPLHISGNYGLLDQIQALHWVKDNIAAFGGDPSNVTIAGESAGGLSVMYLMASPPAHGLFAKAIAESAYMVSTPSLTQNEHGLPSAESVGTMLASAVHAPNIAALRAMDAKTITSAAAAAQFPPLGVVDGHILPDQLPTIFDKGEQAPVPILAGFNAGEIRSLRVLAPPVPASAAAYEAKIRAQYGDLAGAFLKLYPSDDMQESIWKTTRDALYGWTAERLVRNQTTQGEPSFLYYFDHGYPAEDSAGYHAFHGSELPYVFGTPDKVGPLWPKIPATREEAALSDAMLDYWSSFARSGKPTAKNAPDWPAYDSTAAYMNITDAPHPADHLLPGMYMLNEQVMCRRRADGSIAWNWNVGLASPPNPAPSPDCR